MKAPICEFVKKYSLSSPIRAHMPGHKGAGDLKEEYDITEIAGADSLYHCDGIISESEESASSIFGCKTFYSTEGSSQCIRAMIHLISLYSSSNGLPFRICAGRNVHKSFVSACALLDAEVIWHYGKDNGGILGCEYDTDELKDLFLSDNKPTALYVTSPDYLGNIAPIEQLSELCKKYGVILAVDNAHGAYLKFMPQDVHPITLGADICCDSAHKTLPVLTGGAYLHISSSAPEIFISEAKNALALFGSTSPSYLILCSLDACNLYLENLKDSLSEFAPRVEALKERLRLHGYALIGDEKLKITIKTKDFGYLGTELALICEKNGLYTEFSDPDHLVLMLTEKNSDQLDVIGDILTSVKKREKIIAPPPHLNRGTSVMTIRKATLSPSTALPVRNSVGMIAASLTVSCPPAVPIVVSGEVITDEIVEAFEYYGTAYVSVVKEK